MSRIGRAIDRWHVHSNELRATSHKELRALRSQAGMSGEVMRKAPVLAPAGMEHSHPYLAQCVAIRFQMLAADFTARGDAAQINEARQAHAALERRQVDSFRAVEEVERRIYVGAGVDAEIHAAQVHRGFIQNLDPHRPIAGVDGRVRPYRVAEIDDASGMHPIFVMVDHTYEEDPALRFAERTLSL